MRLDQLAEDAGVAGVMLILVAYAGAQFGRLEPRRPAALLLNLTGAGLILWSLAFRFNLAAFLMETAWLLVAVFGLARLALSRARRDGRRSPPSRTPPA